MKKLIASKMKNVPKEQQEMILTLVTENPEFFKDIQKQVEAKKAQGQDEQFAMMQVMRENQAKLQAMMAKHQSK